MELSLVDKWLLLTTLILMFIENGSCGGFSCINVATAFSDAGYSVNISTNTEIGSKVYNLSFSADPSETVELQLQGISNYFELKEDGNHFWSLQTNSCLTVNDEENVEFAVTANNIICDPQVVQMKVQATIPNMPVQEDGDEVEIDKGDCKLGRILEVYEIQPNNANLGSCGVTFSCTAKPDNSDKTFWIENGTWLYTDADCVANNHEYIARVTCVETGASEEYSKEMPVIFRIRGEETCNESFADSTFTTATTDSINVLSVSSTPSQQAVQQNQVYSVDTLGIWPVYVTLSFLIGGATGCVGHYLLGNKCKKKKQQTSVKANDENL